VNVRDVVITGVGAVTPLGVGARVLHERWTAGDCGVRDGEAPCADFTVTEHLSVKEARRADRSTQLAITAGDEALADAGWGDELPYDPELIGCVLGTGIGGIATLESNHDSMRDTGPGAVSPLAVPLMMSNAGSAALSLRHGLQGPVFSVVSACAAGSHAIGTALRMIQHGEAEAMVTGGAEAPEGLDRGYFVRPTVFSEVTPEMTIAQEEIFGPVPSLIPYEDVDDAIAIANDSIYGLNGAVFTNDSEAAYKVARRVRTGNFAQNGFKLDYTLSFGGFKQSGIGREGGMEGFLPYLETKTVFLAQAPSHLPV